MGKIKKNLKQNEEDMFTSYKQMKEMLKREKRNSPNTWFDKISCNQRLYNWKFIKLLRRCELYRYKANIFKNPL